MLLRTLEVPDAQGQLLNAVILCGFTATRINRQFLVYSLNEKSTDELVKIYLTALEGDQPALSMCDASPEMLTVATQVLKDIFRDACASEPRQSEETYTLLDLAETVIRCSAVNTHYSLKVSDTWLMSLLHYEPLAKASTVPFASEDTVSSPPLATQVMSSVADSDDQTISERIEANIKSLIASVTSHKEVLLGKYVELDERQRQFEQREQSLARRELALKKREEALLASVQLLQEGEKQLSGLMAT